MQQLISEKQARAITGGRKPLVPVQYESAIKALVACQTIDDAKMWGDKADALAAWAKIYKNDEVGIEARRLKLHAYRRMGLLAEELRPRKSVKVDGQPFRGSYPGPKTLLKEHGFKEHAAQVIRTLGLLPQKKFDTLVNAPRVLSPNSTVHRTLRSGSAAWKVMAASGGGTPMMFRSFVRNNAPHELARGIAIDERPHARKLVIELIEWLDAFEHHLPREK